MTEEERPTSAKLHFEKVSSMFSQLLSKGDTVSPTSLSKRYLEAYFALEKLLNNRDCSDVPNHKVTEITLYSRPHAKTDIKSPSSHKMSSPPTTRAFPYRDPDQTGVFFDNSSPTNIIKAAFHRPATDVCQLPPERLPHMIHWDEEPVAAWTTPPSRLLARASMPPRTSRSALLGPSSLHPSASSGNLLDASDGAGAGDGAAPADDGASTALAPSTSSGSLPASLAGSSAATTSSGALAISLAASSGSPVSTSATNIFRPAPTPRRMHASTVLKPPIAPLPPPFPRTRVKTVGSNVLKAVEVFSLPPPTTESHPEPPPSARVLGNLSFRDRRTTFEPPKS